MKSTGLKAVSYQPLQSCKRVEKSELPIKPQFFIFVLANVLGYVE